SVRAYQEERLIVEIRSDEKGEFSLSAPAGEYRVEITAAGFTPFREIVPIQPGMQPFSVTLQLAPVHQSLEVRDDFEQIRLEPDQNLTGFVLNAADLTDLPEDEEQLAQVLRDLAGPAADSEAADFIVDGFSGGQLPPRDQIQQIRVNSNPFSSEFSRPGHSRIEVVTRAGTGQFRGNLSFNFRDEALNARNAFADSKPPYQQRSFRANIGGPLLPNRLSTSLALMHSDAEESDSIRAVTPDGLLSKSVVRPTSRWNVNGRLQYHLAEGHTLTFASGHFFNKRDNQGVGETTLPERAFRSESNNFNLQIRESAVLSQSSILETRFQFRRQRSETQPLNNGFAINVLDAFQAGGAPNRNQETERNYEFGSALSISRGSLSLKTGLQLEYLKQQTRSQDNFQGTYVFSSLEAYLERHPTTFTIQRGDPALDLNQLEMGAFLQSDWRTTRNLMLSFGVRYEAQTNIGDKNNFDPRAGFAYSLGQSTVVRGGAGLFHQRFSAGTLQSLLRQDGTRQWQLVVENPCFDPALPDPFACGSAGTVVPPRSLRVRAADLALPYTINSSLSLEKRLPQGLSVAVSYDFIRGIRLYRSRNSNAPLPGQTERPDPARGNIEMLESTASSTRHSLGIRINQRIGRTMLTANYSRSSSYNDSNGTFRLPADNYNLRGEWGRSAQDQRHSLSTAVNFRLPWSLSGNVRLQTNTGRPYDITTGRDDNGDTTVNDRPAGVSRNAGQGPGLFNIDLNFSKTITLGRQNGTGSQPRGGFANSLQQGGPSGFPGGGPGFPGGGPGDFPGGGQGQPRGGKELTISLNIRNLLNHTNFTRFSGVMTSPLFGLPTSARNPREIEMGLRFNF
ncbi:MAG: hypothetical protein HY649_09240, partial [Acidobacteria bacterium]|nr:hypothetical protein [Acidobacteriota bacterium]